MFPAAPSWFTRLLKVYHPTLRVAHVGLLGWEITQMIPQIVDQGVWNGKKLYELKRTSVIVKRFEGYELGSSILRELSSYWPTHFKGYEDFCKHHRVQIR